ARQLVTLGAIYVSLVPEGDWPRPLPQGPGCPRRHGRRTRAEADPQCAHDGYRRGTTRPALALPAMRLVLLQSKIQNRESKIMCRPFGDPNWVTDTAKRLGPEWTIRPRGRPKKQSYACHVYLV